MEDCDVTCKLYLILCAAFILALFWRVASWAIERLIPDKIQVKIIGGDDGEMETEEKNEIE